MEIGSKMMTSYQQHQLFDRQAIYDQVKNHLLTQGMRSELYCGYKGKNVCRYRAELDDGTTLKCAIGALITELHYQSTLEGCNVRDSEVRRALEKSLNLPTHSLGSIRDELTDDITLLQDLQAVHDYCHVIDWSKQLTRVAKKFHLKP